LFSSVTTTQFKSCVCGLEKAEKKHHIMHCCQGIGGTEGSTDKMGLVKIFILFYVLNIK